MWLPISEWANTLLQHSNVAVQTAMPLLLLTAWFEDKYAVYTYIYCPLTRVATSLSSLVSRI